MVRPPLVRRGSYHPAGGRSVASLVCAAPHWGGHTVLRSAWPRCRPAHGRTDGRRAHGSDRARERSRGPDFPVPSRLERAERDRPGDQPSSWAGLERGLGPLGEGAAVARLLCGGAPTPGLGEVRGEVGEEAHGRPSVWDHRTVTRRTLRFAGAAVNARTSRVGIGLGVGQADRPGLNFSIPAPLSLGRKPARMLARALEAEAGDDPGTWPLTR